MNNKLLKTLISNVKRQDMSTFPLIFDEFKKLILLYSRRLQYEDAVSELTLFLIELLYDIELEKFKSDESDDLKRYIAVSIKNKYIALSVSKSKTENFENFLLEDCFGFTQEYDKRFSLFQYAERLSEIQRLIILYHYVYGYSVAEIASYLKVSRQAVNKTKNRALDTLRRELEVEGIFYV